MEVIFLIVGFTSGLIVSFIFRRKEKVYGSIDVDPITGLCRFRLSSDELANPKKKRAIFIVTHDAEISRDEQLL